MARVPLSVLDLSIFGSGSTPGDGLRASLDLAREVEELGYRRYWASEHHLNPGVAGAAPHVLLAAVAQVTERIRLGTAATVLGNTHPLQVVEAAGVVAALNRRGFDLGIGRAGTPGPAPAPTTAPTAAPAGEAAPVGVAAPVLVGAAAPVGGVPHAGAAPGSSAEASPPLATASAPSGRDGNREVDGLVIPPRFVHRPDRAKAAAQARLLGRTPGDDARFEDDLRTVLDLIDDRYDHGDAIEIRATPGGGEDIAVWVHGSSAGESARLAGELGLPFGASYQFAPATVLEAVEAYRRGFRPSAALAQPYVVVSADVLVAPTAAEADELSLGYGRWVGSLREGRGGIPFPSPAEARESPLTEAERAVVQDRLDTRIVGTPSDVVERLDALQRVTGADELVIATHVHDPAHARRSFGLLAAAWV